jgi:hypothetical protein
MLKRLALIFIIVAGLVALQPEVTPAPRCVATSEYVLSAKRQETHVVIPEPVAEKPVPVLVKTSTLAPFNSLQMLLICSQHYYSSLSVA